MTRWRAVFDDGIWRFYRDGIELPFSLKGDIVVDALNKAEARIAELEQDLSNKETEYTDLWDDALALQSRIAELEAAQKEALSLLPELEQGHYYCDDCWYSCPKAVDGCCDESQGDECNCGADNYNALLAKIIGLLTSEVQK